jgi:hypothetical protein
MFGCPFVVGSLYHWSLIVYWIFLLTVPQTTRTGLSLRRYCRLSVSDFLLSVAGCWIGFMGGGLLLFLNGLVVVVVVVGLHF